MDLFLTKIHINKIFHIENVDILISETEKKHLIITGKNGSGKTSLLVALVEFFQRVKEEVRMNFLKYENELQYWLEEIEKRKQTPGLSHHITNAENEIVRLKKKINSVFGKVNTSFNDIIDLSKQSFEGNFIFAFYNDFRRTIIEIPKNPIKPNLLPVSRITENKQNEFIKFLVDLKVQEAMARNENALDDANKIKEWFINFELLLNELFEGEKVSLDFNYKDYSFTINQGNKSFGFNQLSAGYSAIIDIIVDLILKMQHPDSLTRAYEKQGIVLIDEIETHLHLELQKAVLPMLTRVFPNIQFIVTTHSPFVLNSLKNAVAFDLEKKQRLDDLTEYSYEALAEGYFDVTSESSFLRVKLNRYKELILKDSCDAAENFEITELETEFNSLNDTITSPEIIGEYLQLKISRT